MREQACVGFKSSDLPSLERVHCLHMDSVDGCGVYLCKLFRIDPELSKPLDLQVLPQHELTTT